MDEGTNAIFAECQIMHTVTSTDAMYAHTPPSSFTISVLNDDEADVKLQIPQDDGSFEYRLKVMGPMTIDEGASTKYALVLDTQPRSANVSVLATIFAPRPNTPLSVRLEPPSLVFTKSNWNVPQVVTFNASHDDIDNDQDTETFRIVYHAMRCRQVRGDTLSGWKFTLTMKTLKVKILLSISVYPWAVLNVNSCELHKAPKRSPEAPLIVVPLST